ncbi:unnamed protein product [Mytilus edulis]|uniref:Uncharacterized protein n=1 Tax=Mytilus edulis TaxID=6550 RepID=A0A8S3SEL4_MYTED|nr:unnamed protein product [Mytilus edulis]
MSLSENLIERLDMTGIPGAIRKLHLDNNLLPTVPDWCVQANRNTIADQKLVYLYLSYNSIGYILRIIHWDKMEFEAKSLQKAKETIREETGKTDIGKEPEGGNTIEGRRNATASARVGDNWPGKCCRFLFNQHQCSGLEVTDSRSEVNCLEVGRHDLGKGIWSGHCQRRKGHA